MDLPAAFRDAAFIEALGRARSAADIRAAVALIAPHLPGGTRALYFTTDFEPISGGTELGRVLFVIPGAESDRYVQIPMPTVAQFAEDPSASRTTNVSFIDVRHHDGEGRALVPVQTRFVDLERPRLAVPLAPRDHGSRGDCISCHISETPLPIRALDPAHEMAFIPSSSTAAAVKSDINARIAGYGRGAIEGLDREAMGPPLGAAEAPWRTPSFLQRCAAVRLSPESLLRVGRAMNCASCHDGAAQPALLDRAQIVNGVNHASRPMPPGNHLSADERTALINCLEHEDLVVSEGSPRFTWARRFLTPPECEPPSTGTSTTTTTTLAPDSPADPAED